MSKVLIIKLGYSETVDWRISEHTSYGDVLRSTALLHHYKDDKVTWLVDEKSAIILKDNPLIDRVLVYDVSTSWQIESERFDVVVNLEKTPGICALADKVTAGVRYGFRFDPEDGVAEAYKGTESILRYCQNDIEEFAYNEPIQKGLYEMVGATWQGEEYVLAKNYVLKPREYTFDVGFNWAVGNKFAGKKWAMENWEELATLLGDGGMMVGWQKDDTGIERYLEWIQRCKLIVTNDSFGMHAALAYGIPVVALFGPTNPNQVCMYDRGNVIKGHTVDDISVRQVFEAVKGMQNA